MPKDPIRKCPYPERGRLIAMAVAVGLVLGMAGPTSAQFFNFGGYQQRPQPQRGGGWFGNEQRGGGWFGGDPFAPYQQQYAPPRHSRQAAPAREDFSKAPPSEKRNTVPERHILVLGDSMADWLAYGLEGVYADQPEMGVIRKHKTGSGLIKYQPKGNPADWAAAAKGILATEKADAIVVMLGLDDRVAIREPAADKLDKPGEKKDAKAKPDGKSLEEKAAAKPDGGAKQVDSELAPEDAADNNGVRPSAGQDKSAGSPSGLREFREKRWDDLYREKIDEMIGVLKAKGVPVLWVGLPAVRGVKATSDAAFLDGLYREAAGRAGITYVDVWDGFVDEAGRFHAARPRFRRTDPKTALLRWRVLHQGRRAQACALCRARTQPPAGCAFRADRAADRAGNPRRQCTAGSAGAASVGRADRSPGGLFGQRGSIARRSRVAIRDDRRASRAAVDQRRGLAGTRRPRRRFCLAAPRNRTRWGEA